MPARVSFTAGPRGPRAARDLVADRIRVDPRLCEGRLTLRGFKSPVRSCSTWAVTGTPPPAAPVLGLRAALRLPHDDMF